MVSIILRALGRPAGHSILPFPALPIVVAGETLDAERFLSGDRRGSSPIAWRAFCQFAIVRPGPWAAVPTASGLRTPYDYADRSPDAASNRRGFAAGCQHNQQVSIAPIPSEARLPRRPAGGHLQGAQAQSDTRAKLRSDGRAGMAGENGGSHPGPRATSHPLLCSAFSYGELSCEPPVDDGIVVRSALHKLVRRASTSSGGSEPAPIWWTG